MEIVLVSPEVVPFSKVGGLGDVAGSLPKALKTLGHKVTVVSLLYGSINLQAGSLARRLVKVRVPFGGETVGMDIHEARLPSGVHVVLLGAPGVSDRPGIYGDDQGPYADNHRRFGMLCRGAVEWLRAQPRLPDIVHAHDWPAALVPVYLDLLRAEDPGLAQVKSVFTIHNLSHQGTFPLETLAELGLPARYGTVDALEFYGAASWIKGAILLADRVNTVSPSYARELLSAEGGLGMDGVLRTRGELLGILNGIDHAVWNPSTDPHLVSRYDAEDLTGKVRCKADLQQRLGLPLRPDTPVLGLVARIVAQKGLDLLLAAAPRLLRQEVQLVVQGQGDAGLLDSLAELQRRMPDRVACRREWDDGLAHRIYAGSDLFLVPSHFEPCGLSQMYAMRYGSVPVARATGGLRDTIVDADTELTTGTGFAFEDPSEEDLFGALSRALAGYAKREAFGRLVRRVMRTDLSWERGARRYQSLYASLCPAEAPAASASR